MSYEPTDMQIMAAKNHSAEMINSLVYNVKARNERWWTCIETGLPLKRNVGELLMLIVSELGEGLDGDRKQIMDTHLPHRKMLEVELADALIRIFDMAGGLGLDLGGAYAEKMEYNAQRADHKIENRVKPGGKKY